MINCISFLASPPGEPRDLAKFPIRVTPGPFEVSPRVMLAAQKALCGHREPEFVQLIRENQNMLCDSMEVSSKIYFPVVFDSSGSGAMEAMVSAIVPDKKPLVLVNGRFGQRLADIVLIYRSDAHILYFPKGTPIELETVNRTMKAHPDIELLLFCRQDTREGILNPLKSLCDLAYERGLMIAIDAISSEVCEELAAEQNHIALFTASSGKAFRSLPGLGIVFGRKDLLEVIDSQKIQSYYFNLSEQFRIQFDYGESRFAPSSPLHFCLNEALHELLEEGALNRRNTIQRRTFAVQSAMERLGLRLSIPLGHRSNSVTSVILPDKVKYGIFYKNLRQEGFLVYKGSSVIEDCFQIGTGGYLTDEILIACFDAIKRCLE